MSPGWQGAPYGGRVSPSHPGARRLTVEVLLYDSRGQSLRLIADGFTVDDAIAAAEDDAARRFRSDYAYTDWRPDE